MAGTYTNLLYHLIFSTKDRQPLITPALRPELHQYMGGIVRSLDGIALEIGGMPDHVHLLVKIKPDLAVSELLRVTKCNSSKWANERPGARDRFEWQGGYGAFTVSESQVTSVRDYIARQGEHHKTLTFQEEFVAMLQHHGIKFDSRYIWQ